MEDILDAILQIADHHGSVRDRVMFRNWSDSALSDERSPFIGFLQRRLVQLAHVPADSDRAVLKNREYDKTYDKSTVEDLDGAVVGRAARWALRMLADDPDTPVTVVAVGLRVLPELPDGVDLVLVSFLWNADTTVDVVGPTTLIPQIRVGRRLW